MIAEIFSPNPSGVVAALTAYGRVVSVDVRSDEHHVVELVDPRPGVVFLWGYHRRSRPNIAVTFPDNLLGIISCQPTFSPDELTLLADGTLATTKHASELALEARSSSSARKPALQASIERALHDGDVPSWIRDDALAAFDELYMNAIFNAPVAADGTRPHRGRERGEQVKSVKPATVRVLLDHDRVGIEVTDSYGTLRRSDIAKALTRCLQPEGAEPWTDSGGAGLGLCTVTMMSSVITFRLRPGESTAITFVRFFQERRRQFAETAPYLLFL